MKTRHFLLAFLALATVSCGLKKGIEMSKILTQVDPTIGTGGHGHVFVGANVPFGMVQAGPQQIIDAWDWCSGYHESDTLVIGFSHTHLSGTGIGDLGDIMLMPYDPSKKLYTSLFMDRKKQEAKHIYAHLDHSKELVMPGYYQVRLDDYGVDVRLSATTRSAIHEYTFSGDQSAILLDLCSGIGWDIATDWAFEQTDATHLQGYRRSMGWARDQIAYFYAEFSQPFTLGEKELLTAEKTPYAREPESAQALLFDTAKDKKVTVRVGISPVSEAGAKANLDAEQGAPGKRVQFEMIQGQAVYAWMQALGKIEIEPLDATQGKIFYTALYHSMIAPALFSDSDGNYRGADGQVYNSPAGQYTIYSLWDAYRAAFPLMTILEPARCRNFAESFMNIYAQQGKLPVWHLWGNETDCMVGNPGVIILGDLVKKGLYTDKKAALEAMVASEMKEERGLEFIKQYGYIPYDKSEEVETVAKALEFAIADYAVAETAAAVGDSQTEAQFRTRSRLYEHYFDPETQFMRAAAADGSFREPFDPFRALHMRDDYTEGNAWQYTWLVPHDAEGLIRLFGGREPFLKKLDALFKAEGDLGGSAADVTGLIGQYAHGNEPVHHVAYLYNIAGRQDRTCEVVRTVMDSLYTATPDGLCGNEDVGQMSAWYVLSALGLYQMNPVGGDFQIGSPAVKKAVIHLENGNTFTVLAPANSKENIYVKSMKFNGEPLSEPHLTYAQVMAGGTLELEMTAERP